MRVVFMGTPDIAATCLKKILEHGCEVVGVYTQPDRPKNRGMKLQPSPVKEVALAHNIPVFQPENFREAETVEQLRSLQPDVVAVVAYGRILPQSVLDIPPRGCINIHASLLPQYRGSAPYQWAVLDGLKETGVTAMYLCREMDAGDIIDIAKTPIAPEETAGELLDRLAELGAELLSKTLRSIREGTAKRTPQDGSLATYAPMLDKTMCPLDWNRTARQLHDQIRGLNPWPVATTELQGKRFKIYESRVVDVTTDAAPGTILVLTKTGLQIACGEGVLEIRNLQAEGGKRMAAPDYFRGHPLEL
ncbi:MAG: methionyl-tRNA formyltransferase [Oscillospiraceae bacterium]|nr:methionyl-tRNA formyltransferase [Oscillospiraceae bacterium]